MGIHVGVGAWQHVGVAFGAGGATARTLDSVTVGAFSSGTYPVTLVGDAVDGETVEWVLYSGTDPADGDEVDAGTWAGATVVDSGTFAWAASPAPITLTTGIARANYKLTCILNNGAISNAVISTAFEVDTTASLLTSESFTDGGAEDVDWAFTSNEDVSYRVSLWADGSTPSAAEIESGTGSVATVTGTAAATVAETGTFAAVGDGVYVPTLWVSDGFLNEYTETYADVTVAVSGGSAVVSSFTGFNQVGNVYTSTTLNPSMTFSTGGDIEYLIVGGGGGGGNGELRAGGGGGGGEVKAGTMTVTATTYNPTVGAGGAGGAAATSGATGGSSTFNGITAAGGGGGGRNNAAGLASVNSGGSGFAVGSSTASTGGGFAGGAGLADGSNDGAPGGGGGGMSAAGGIGTLTTIGGAGGAGLSNSITGSAVVYGSGGGGGIKGAYTGGPGGSGAGNGGTNTGAGQAGTDGRGGGGGGGSSGSALGGDGGDGVIIIKVI